MSKKIPQLSTYIGWLFKQYQQAKQEARQREAYKIVAKEANKSGVTRFTVQLSGKATTFKLTAQEIIADDSLMEGFSKQDIRTVTYYACQDLHKPKTKVVIQNFCEKLNKTVFGIKHFGEEDIKQMTASDISLDKELLRSLNQEEAHLVGYVSANDKIAEEKAMMEKLLSESAD